MLSRLRVGLRHRVDAGQGVAVRDQVRRALPADHEGDRQVLCRGTGRQAADPAAAVIVTQRVQLLTKAQQRDLSQHGAVFG